MLLYDWKKIYKHSGGSSTRILQILRAMLGTEMPKSFYDPAYKYSQIDFSGHSYLLNPFALLKHRWEWKDKEIADYIGLASFRNLNNYKLFDDKTLDLSHSPMGQDAINKNRLLRIDQDKIHFYYEDYAKEKK